MPHALLANNLIGAPDARWAYWFVAALVQILLLVGAVLAIPALRRAERHAPFALALTAAACTLAVRFDLVELGLDGHRTSRAHEIAWLFALGWVAALADDTRRRLVATALIVASVPAFFGDREREALITIGMLLALWVRTVPVVAPLHRLAGRLASASLWIYLCRTRDDRTSAPVCGAHIPQSGDSGPKHSRQPWNAPLDRVEEPPPFPPGGGSSTLYVNRSRCSATHQDRSPRPRRTAASHTSCSSQGVIRHAATIAAHRADARAGTAGRPGRGACNFGAGPLNRAQLQANRGSLKCWTNCAVDGSCRAVRRRVALIVDAGGFQGRRRGRLMVVDDDANFSRVLRMALEDDGFEVVTAPDPQGALEVLRGWSPQAVILDLNLATADGLALLVRLRAMGPVGQLPVVVLTAADDDERRARGLDLGADRYLTKPVDVELLVWHLDELLGSSRPAPVNPLVGLRQQPTIPRGLLSTPEGMPPCPGGLHLQAP